MTLKFEKQTPCEASIGEGWHVLVQPLIDQAEAEGNQIVQIKEKFGGLRFYVNGAVSDDLQGKISDAEARSFEICELCGDPVLPFTRDQLSPPFCEMSTPPTSTAAYARSP